MLPSEVRLPFRKTFHGGMLTDAFLCGSVLDKVMQEYAAPSDLIHYISAPQDKCRCFNFILIPAFLEKIDRILFNENSK